MPRRRSLATTPPPNPVSRYLVTFQDPVAGQPSQALRLLDRLTGVQHLATARDFADSAIDPRQAQEGYLLDGVGIAVVNADPSQLAALQDAAADRNSGILAVEPDLPAKALFETNTDYVRGYRDAVNHLYDQIRGGTRDDAEAMFDTKEYTWGVLATGANETTARGRDVGIAVLDTGFDTRHVDFRGRDVESRSFIPG